MKKIIELKAKLLCQGMNPDATAEELFRRLNPSNAKRGGLSSGGKMKLDGNLLVNAPFYRKRKTDIKVIADPTCNQGVLIKEKGETVCAAKVLPAPNWYKQKVNGFDITQILTAHNRQLAGAVYEDCALFKLKEECKFCVMNRSLNNKAPALIKKTGNFILNALKKIPVQEYGGLTLNGGMTLGSDRGIKAISLVASCIYTAYPNLPIAVEITPPEDLNWIDKLADSGVKSLMMNLECWDPKIREQLIPGKNKYCSRDMYLKAFERALKVFGPGRVSTCFIVGTEPIESLKKGIREVVRMGIIPSPLAGRYFENIPEYPFVPNLNWKQFLEIFIFATKEMQQQGINTTDKAGCVACGMCDLIRDL